MKNDKKNKKQKIQMGGNNMMWGIASPFILLILFHIFYILYLKISGYTVEWNIKIDHIIIQNKEGDGTILWPSYFIIFFNILFNILIKPYRGWK